MIIVVINVNKQVAVAAEEKTKTRKRKRSRKSKEKKRSRKQNGKTKKMKIPVSRCVPGCLLKLSEYMGLQTIHEKMKKILNRNFHFSQVIVSFTNDSDFKIESIPCNTFDPLLVDPKHIFVLQLCSVHVHNDKVRDNQHSVALFDNKIFDWNIEQPLSLTKDNLDRCCLGGEDWVYKHCSRVKRLSIQGDKNNKH